MKKMKDRPQISQITPIKDIYQGDEKTYKVIGAALGLGQKVSIRLLNCVNLRNLRIITRTSECEYS
jgi:hypothetical protein